LRALLNLLAEERKTVSAEYGLVSAQSIGAIQRALLRLEQEGGNQVFGEPVLVGGEDPDHATAVGGGAPAPVLELPAVAALGTVREPARGRRPGQAAPGVRVRRGPPAVRRRTAGAAAADRTGGADHPLQGRGRVLLLPVPQR